MTETRPDFTAYEARLAAGRALAAEIAPLNRTALFDALAAAGIARVVVAFDGSGDSGQIEHIDAYDAASTTTPLPEVAVPFGEAAFDGSRVERRMLTVPEVIEVMAYDFLEQTHEGWENSDGAYGEFSFTVVERSIQLEYNERYMETTFHHALSSARRWGGTADDYLGVHEFLDGSKEIVADFRHRALRHHAEGVFMAERLFGVTLTLSTGRLVPVRLVAERHILEDLGRIPSFADWVRCIRPEPWMGRTGDIEPFDALLAAAAAPPDRARHGLRTSRP